MIPVAAGPLTSVQDRAPEPARTGIFVAFAAITMMFAAFTSAMFVRESSATDWMHINLPRLIYFNTFLMIMSSVTLEIGRRKVGSFVRGLSNRKAESMRWLAVTLALGLGFV